MSYPHVDDCDDTRNVIWAAREVQQSINELKADLKHEQEENARLRAAMKEALDRHNFDHDNDINGLCQCGLCPACVLTKALAKP